MKKEVNIDRIYPNKKGKYCVVLGGIIFTVSSFKNAISIARTHYAICGKNVQVVAAQNRRKPSIVPNGWNLLLFVIVSRPSGRFRCIVCSRKNVYVGGGK